MDAGQRIAAAIHQTEDAIQPLAQEPDRYLESQPLRWMVLTEDLAAATTGSITTPSFAAANPANWQAAANGGTGGYVVDTAVTYTVAETTGLADYHAGDWLLCRPLGTTGGFVWEPIPGGCCLNHPTSGSGSDLPQECGVPCPPPGYTQSWQPVSIDGQICLMLVACQSGSGSGGFTPGYGVQGGWTGMPSNSGPSTEGQIGANQDYGSGYGGVNIAYIDANGNDWTSFFTGLPTDGSATVTLTNLGDNSTIATFAIISLNPQTGPPNFITLRSNSPGDVPDLSSSYSGGIGLTITT